MDKFTKTLEILESTQTNWEVQKLPLVSQCGKPTGCFGLFRSDNDKWLGTFKDSYQVMQNASLVEMLVEATQSLNIDVCCGGVLREGGRVYYQMPLPDDFIGNSGIKRYVTALNSHDGSAAISFGSSNQVIICENTFNYVHKKLDKVKHTAHSQNRVKELAESLKMTIELDKLMMDSFKRMAEKPLKKDLVESMIKSLFYDNKPKQDKFSKRTENQVISFNADLAKEIELEGDNVWGLFNAVTRYTNHTAAPNSISRKEEYLMHGTGAKLSAIAYEQLIDYINENTAEYHFISK